MILEKLFVSVIIALNDFFNFSKTHHFYEKNFQIWKHIFQNHF